MSKIIELLKNKLPILRWLTAKAKKIVRFNRHVNALSAWTNEDEKRKLFYAQLFSPGNTVFDIGANVGNRVKIFAALDTKVIAFEPQPDCISVLEKGFASNDRITIVPKAIGAEAGRTEMLVSDAHTLSSMSPNWISAVKKSGRFEKIKWDQPITVEKITFENAIETYGSPDFVKIDVEGYELEVLKGLETPIQCLSIEFTPEYIETTNQCIDRLTALGDYEFQVSIGETMEFYLDTWISAQELVSILPKFSTDVFADIYARRILNKQTAGK